MFVTNVGGSCRMGVWLSRLVGLVYVPYTFRVNIDIAVS